MSIPLYRRQLKHDIARWVELGLIDETQGEKMLANAGTGFSGQSLVSILAILGVILLGASAIAFIAANFWSFPKIIQLALLFSLMWAAFSIGWWLIERGKPLYGQAAYLLGAGLFGVNIMLIGQIYHINAHWPDGIMIWAIGALATAIAVPSGIVLGLAFALGAIWTGSESFAFDSEFHWPFLLFWIVAFTLAMRLRSNIGFHLGVLSIILWLVSNSYQLADQLDWQAGELVSAFSVLWIGFWPLSAILLLRGFSRAPSLTNYSVLLFLIAFYLLHVITENDLGVGVLTWWIVIATFGIAAIAISLRARQLGAYSLSDVAAVASVVIASIAYPLLYPAAPVLTEWLYRALFMIFCIWAVDRGTRTQNQFLINVAILAFGVEILYVYFGKFSSFMSDAAFFFVGGVVLIAVSLGLDRFRRRAVSSGKVETQPLENSGDAS